MSFHLLHADAHLLVLDKPADLLAVPGRGADKQDCLSARVQAVYPDARVVHRLDMATSGLMLMARGAAAQSALSRAFAERKVGKRYIAVVAGSLAAPGSEDGWGLIDLPIRLDWPKRPLRVIDLVQGKPSQTRWRVAAWLPPPRPSPARGGGSGSAGISSAIWDSHTEPESSPACGGGPGGGKPLHPSTTRLELDPLTGRSHQLRVHLQALGHPILGDTLYAPPQVQSLADRLLLHASEIAFAHPVSGEALRFESPAPF